MDQKALIEKAVAMVLDGMKAAAMKGKAAKFGKKPTVAKLDVVAPADDAELPPEMMADESGAGDEGDPAEEAAEPSDEEMEEMLRMSKK